MEENAADDQNVSKVEETKVDPRRNSYDEKMKRFRKLLMRENLDIVAKLKVFKKTDFRRKIVLNQLKELKKLSELSKMWVSVPYIKQTFDFPVITVDSSKAGSNIDALRLAINELGWKECPSGCNNKPCHVVWNSCSFNENRNNIGSFVNKHPGITQCLHKVAFSRILETMRILFPDHYDFYPMTWYLPHQMVDFTLYCKNREAKSSKEKYYIVKPDSGTQGEGIYLIQKPQDYKMSSKTFVVQEYLAYPLLLDGFKFDLRIYAILLSLDPLTVYLCNEGLARFCTKKYVPPSSDNLNISYMHLTNYSLNKKSTEFVHTQNVDSGSKRTVSSVFAFLEAEGYDVVNIWKKLEKLVYKTVLAIVPQLKVHYINEVIVKSDNVLPNNQPDNEKERPSCFQILGFDVLIMDDLQPILLEVNSNPSMRLDCEMEIAPGICEYYVSKVDVKIKKPLVRDTLKLLQHHICERFNLDMREFKSLKDMPKPDHDNVNDVEGITENEKEFDSFIPENTFDICRKWSAESLYGPHFIEIAKKNKTLPKYFEINEPSSTVDSSKEVDKVNLESDSSNSVKISETDSDLQEEQKRRFDQLAQEKNWVNFPNEETQLKNAMKTFMESENSNLQSSESESSTESDSCLKLISTDSYKYLYEELRILEETAVIFYSSMGHRYSENMGATAFRTFGRQCKLHLLGFNHAIIDLIYIEVQRRWSFINNYDSKHGLCYQAFVEAFFQIAFVKFTSLSNSAAVQNLIEHCKKSIGPKHFNWTKTLYPRNNYQRETGNEIKNYIKSKANKQYFVLSSSNSISTKSKSDYNGNISSPKDKLPENSKEKTNIKPNKQQLRNKYEFMKAIHEIYRKKLKASIREQIEYDNNDSDSVKSLPIGKNEEKINVKLPNLPYIDRNISISSTYPKENFKNGSLFQKSNKYEKPENVIKQNGDLSQTKSNDNVYKNHKSNSQRTGSPNSKLDSYVRPKNNFNIDKTYVTKLPSENYGNIIKPTKTGSQVNKSVLSPINDLRMRKLISVYGVDSQDFVKRSLDKINKKFSILKPI